jgi:hypothetical protein
MLLSLAQYGLVEKPNAADLRRSSDGQRDGDQAAQRTLNSIREIEDVVIMPSEGEQGINMARMIALSAGCPLVS